MRLAVIGLARTGHTAIMRWLERDHGPAVDICNKSWESSLANVADRLPILVVRDFPNWAASSIAKYIGVDEKAMDAHIDLWVDHVKHAFTVPTIVYHHWVLAGHGEHIEGGPSSFRSGSVLTRYEQVDDDARWLYMMRRADALQLSERISEGSSRYHLVAVA